MAHKRAIIGTLAFLLVAVLAVGYFALAAEIGGKDNPLVTLSYLSGIEPQLEAQIDQMITQQTQKQADELDAKYAQAKDSLQKMIDDFSGANAGAITSDPAFMTAVVNAVLAQMDPSGSSTGTQPETFKRVDIPSGKTVTLGMGSMAFLRSGAAKCYSTGSPGLINLSDGTALENNSALVKNNLYSVTFDSGRGFKTSEASIVFILGSYSIQ